jgi:aryl-alcohol dehydrogenase-like predicted oxidoreductase
MFELRTVTLPGSTRSTTALGFGCNNLLGDKTRAQGLDLLHTAYDCGIRHFDVARYYGYGDAEGLVGEFAAGKRDQITITTKFGMQPLKSVAKHKGIVQIARRLMRSSSFIRRMVQRKVHSMVQAGQFDVPTAQGSLEMSLRMLKTDYIDLYLLHEATAADCGPELLEFLQRAQNEGKIRAFGIGSAYSKVADVLKEKPAFTSIVQFESSITAPNLEAIRAMRTGTQQLIVTHGSFSAASQLQQRVADDAAFAKRCKEALANDLADTTVLAGFILQQALRANKDGLVLFRGGTPERIRSNVRAATQVALADERLNAFEEIGRTLSATPG